MAPRRGEGAETVGDRVSQARRELAVALRRDITPTDLAVLAGVPPSTVTRIESGLTAPREETIAKLARVLVPVGWDAARLRYGIVRAPPPPPTDAARGEVAAFVTGHQRKGSSEQAKRRGGGKG